jgi:hypothetical protein
MTTTFFSNLGKLWHNHSKDNDNNFFQQLGETVA